MVYHSEFGGRMPAWHILFLRVGLLSAARREEVVGAVWAEIDVKNGTWTIPASRRKDTRALSRRRRRAAADMSCLSQNRPGRLLETLGRAGRLISSSLVGAEPN